MSAEPRIFIVDDDEAIRDSLQLLLQAAGFGTIVAYASARDFLAQAAPGAGECLLLDVRMPEMDGLELQQELNRRGVRLPVIVMTGHGDVPIAVRAMKAGASDFIEKPFSDDLLIDCVRRARQRAAEGLPRERRGRRDQAPARESDAARAPGAPRHGRRPAQQAHRLRSRHQPAHGRDPPRAGDGEDAGAQPLGPGAPGLGGGGEPGLTAGQSHMPPSRWAGRIDHGGTEDTEKRRMARFARPTPLLLRALRVSVVNPTCANAIALGLTGGLIQVKADRRGAAKIYS